WLICLLIPQSSVSGSCCNHQCLAHLARVVAKSAKIPRDERTAIAGRIGARHHVELAVHVAPKEAVHDAVVFVQFAGPTEGAGALAVAWDHAAALAYRSINSPRFAATSARASGGQTLLPHARTCASFGNLRPFAP